MEIMKNENCKVYGPLYGGLYNNEQVEERGVESLLYLGDNVFNGNFEKLLYFIEQGRNLVEEFNTVIYPNELARYFDINVSKISDIISSIADFNEFYKKKCEVEEQLVNYIRAFILNKNETILIKGEEVYHSTRDFYHPNSGYDVLNGMRLEPSKCDVTYKQSTIDSLGNKLSGRYANRHKKVLKK